MTPTKVEPGSDLHLSLLMAPHGLNLIVGNDRALLLAYARDVWIAASGASAGALPTNKTESGVHQVSSASPSQGAVQVPSLSALDRLARVFADSYSSPHHFTLSVESLRKLLLAAAPSIPTDTEPAVSSSGSSLPVSAESSATTTEPCPRGKQQPDLTCTNRHQWWEPCGELGNDERHVRVAGPALTDAINKAVRGAK